MLRETPDHLGRAVLGGMWGGASAGLAEVAMVVSSSAGLPEYGLLPFAFIGYALLGGAVGLGVGIAITLIAPARRAASGFGPAAAAALSALLFVVGRYHVNQRFFGEELSVSTGTGILAHVALLVLAAVAAVGALRVGGVLDRCPRPLLTAATALLAVAGLCIGAGRLRTPTDTIRGRARVKIASDTRPPVVLVIADTLRADAVGAYGAEMKTPAMDALAAGGVRFSNAYVQSTWTRPSIATILTSLHPSAHGATQKQSILPDRVLTLAETFHDAGYLTAAFVSNINVAPVFNFQQGFAEYTYLPPAFYFGASDSAARLALYRMARLLRERFLAERIYAANFYQDAQVVTDRAIDWLRMPRGPGPFFLLVHYMDPHDPYFEIPYNGKGAARVSMPRPPEARRAELHSLYRRNVEYLDEHLHRLWQALRDSGLYDPSVILFTADHGEEFFEHGGWWHGTTLYEEQVRVPLMLKLPHGTRSGAVVERPVETIDVAPTLLSAAGLSSPASFAGHDLLRESAERPLVAEEDHEGNVLASVRLGSWKLITANANNPRGLAPLELYDLARDPLERANIASKETGRVAEMLAVLAGEQKSILAKARARR